MSISFLWWLIKLALEILCGIFIVLYAFALIKKGDSVYDNEPEQKNPLAGKKVIFVNDDNDKERLYPPYKFEIEMIKNNIFDSNLLEKIRIFYRN